jgi:hypothetical protein
MAVLPAQPGNPLVLDGNAGAGWLYGPLRLGRGTIGGSAAAGPLFYAGLWIALLLYVAVLTQARRIPVRVAVAAIVVAHLVFLLAPPLLSRDVFSYLAYARLGVVHDLNPYVHAPDALTGNHAFLDLGSRDAVLFYAGSRDAVSAYGPLFTLSTYALAKLGIGTAFWILKVVAALASLGIVALVWRVAVALDRDPVAPSLAVALHPLVLSHVVAGAHNEALVVLVTMAGAALWLGGRAARGSAVATVAVGLKASAGLVVPFLALGDPDCRQRARADDATRKKRSEHSRRLASIAAVIFALAAIALVGFGTHALDAFSLINSNQDRSSRWSFPYKTAQLLGALLPGDRLDYRHAVRALYAAAFVGVFALLLWRTWRDRIAALDAAAWATLAILVASAWLVPWYILWLLPLAALSRDRRLHIATLALSAWMLAIAVPL